jgi:hypothetical protein
MEPTELSKEQLLVLQEQTLLLALVQSATALIQASISSPVETDRTSVGRADLFLTKMFNRGLEALSSQQLDTRTQEQP